MISITLGACIFAKKLRGLINQRVNHVFMEEVSQSSAFTSSQTILAHVAYYAAGDNIFELSTSTSDVFSKISQRKDVKDV